MKSLLIFFISLLLISSCGNHQKSRNLNAFSRPYYERNLCDDSPDKPLRPNVIYGNDNRLDIYELCNSQHFEMAESTLALIRSSQILDSGNGLEIQTSHFGKAFSLCPEEPFYNQKVAAFCSAFLVTPNTVVTAAHCISSQAACEKTKFVFGYSMHTPNHNPALIKPEDVYSCGQLIHAEFGQDNDYAVIQLDRDVVGRSPLEIRRQGAITIGSPLVVIGHPSGLPTKVADGAYVRSLNGPYFTSNLDTYGGNSGSPVFNEISGMVEGLLVRGEVDYIFDRQRKCSLSFRCPDDSCSGEVIIKITEVLKHIPEENF